MTAPDRISVSLALSALEEQVLSVEEAVQHLYEQRAARDNLIRDARENGIGYPRLVRITGLSRERLVKIINQPMKEEGQ